MCKAHSRSFIICIHIRASFITAPWYGARCWWTAGNINHRLLTCTQTQAMWKRVTLHRGAEQHHDFSWCIEAQENIHEEHPSSSVMSTMAPCLPGLSQRPFSGMFSWGGCWVITRVQRPNSGGQGDMSLWRGWSLKHQLSIRDLTPWKSFIWVFGEQASVGLAATVPSLCCAAGGRGGPDATINQLLTWWAESLLEFQLAPRN